MEVKFLPSMKSPLSCQQSKTLQSMIIIDNQPMNPSLLLLSLLAVSVLCAPDEDLVPTLKGFYDYSGQFKMYSGYLTLQAEPLINSHYIFITSKSNPATDDVVLWLNGGPGCSSLLGFLQEHGPHILNQGADKLAPSKNPFSWNNHANMLFLESPPGVGFSINNDPAYTYSDTQTAKDNLKSIALWFQKFPEFSNNNFWISGESYCGMYIPLLANEVLKNIDTIIPDKTLKFKGFLIGNGVMVTESHWRRQARNTFFSRHYFYGPEIQALIAKCKYDSSDDTNPSCMMGNKLADEATKRINPYNSIGICYAPPADNKPRRRFWYSAFDQELYNQIDAEPGCSSDENGISLFFNDKDVQQQLHVPNMLWESCSDKIGSTFKKDASTLGLFEDFKKAGLKILLFTGNVDAQVSYIETEEYIKRIGWKVIKAKQSVLNPRGSLQALITLYDGLTYYVVNAAGHMVPSDKPNAALKMFQNFIQGKI